MVSFDIDRNEIYLPKHGLGLLPPAEEPANRNGVLVLIKIVVYCVLT